MIDFKRTGIVGIAIGWSLIITVGVGGKSGAGIEGDGAFITGNGNGCTGGPGDGGDEEGEEDRE